MMTWKQKIATHFKPSISTLPYNGKVKSFGESALKPVNTEPEECLSCGASVRGVLYRTRRFSFAATRPDGVAHTGKNRRVPPSPPILT